MFGNIFKILGNFNEAKENIMETLRDDIKEEQEEMKKAEANVSADKTSLPTPIN